MCRGSVCAYMYCFFTSSIYSLYINWVITDQRRLGAMEFAATNYIIVNPDNLDTVLCNLKYLNSSRWIGTSQNLCHTWVSCLIIPTSEISNLLSNIWFTITLKFRKFGNAIHDYNSPTPLIVIINISKLFHASSITSSQILN